MATKDHAPLLRAIRARLYGEWDQPDLVKMGHLFTDSDQDIIAWIDAALDEKKPGYSMARFCTTCHKSLGGKSPEGRKGFVDGSTMHVVGAEKPTGALALCGMRHDGINAVDTIEPVKLGSR